MQEFIENLALEKSFSDLSPVERDAVLRHITPEAYAQLRALLLAAPALDQGPGPSAALRERLLARMAAPAPARRWFNRQIPLWQAAAVAGLAVAAVMLFQKPVIREVHVPLVQQHTDTLYLEKTVWKDRVVVREKVVFRESTTATPLAEAPETAPAPQPSGAPLGKDPGLMEFFVQIQ